MSQQQTLELDPLPAKKVTEKGLVRQGNLLVRAHLSLDSIEAKIFTYMLAGVDHDDKEFRKIAFPMSLVTTNRGGSGYKQVREACEGLMNKKINIPKEGSRHGFHLYQLIPDIGLDDSGEGIISGTFHPVLKPYLLNLKENYTTSEIEKLLSLKSGYAHRLFWYLKSYENMLSKTRVEEWEELKNILLGTSKTYRQNSDFRTKVFEPAFEQVIASGAFYALGEDGNPVDNTPTVTWAYRKKGKRTITHVEFKFTLSTQRQKIALQQKKKQQQPPKPEDNPEQQQKKKQGEPTLGQVVHARMLDFGFTLEQADEAVAKTKQLPHLLAYLNQELAGIAPPGKEKKPVAKVWLEIIDTWAKGTPLKLRNDYRLQWNQKYRDTRWQL